MQNELLKSKRLLTTVVASTLLLANLSLPIGSVNADINAPTRTAPASIEGFSFVATILDSNGKTLSGKVVELRDITDSSNRVIATQKSDEAGKAVFSQLPINRSISVTVDGVAKGYTLRTSETGSQMASSFTAAGVGQSEPEYTNQTIDVYVRNQDAEPLSNKSVSLKDRNNHLIETVTSGQDGLARFSNNLLDGTFYSYSIGDKQYGETVPGNTANIYIDETIPKLESQTGFTFTASIIGKNGKVIEGKSVELYDVTDGKAVKLNSLLSGKDGKVKFEHLPLSRNISISVEGISQGYTVRTSEDGDERAAAFYVNENGTKLPEYTKIPLTITVRDEEGNGLANQLVTLSNKQGKVVAELLSDKDGKVTFSDNLMEGTFYSVKVNGVAMEELMPGNDVSIYLTNEQIQKNKTKNTSDHLEKRDEDEKAGNDSSVKTGTNSEAVQRVGLVEKSKDKLTSPVSSAKDSSATKLNSTNSKNLSNSKQLNRFLPKTGSEKRIILSLVGLISLSIASLILLANKYKRFLK